ncbi:RNA polymerase sigma-70 factor [Chitinophaga barathri]|uniref:RNA polymerase sigma-70 factor n=2 Tax=Chitinophaga barathri TaxID=1647451 RepID=A0A3N4M938_9BACT|nr:RNA polymerase sigma-70 factor [Chitinophaga barathri]
MHSELTTFDTFWKTGDMESFKRLMKSFGPMLHYFAGSIVENAQEAEEIVSDVFIKVWQQRQHFPPPDNVRYYLLTAVKNTALNYLKGKGRRAAHYAAWEVQVSRRNDHSPEEILISKEDIRSIQNIIGQLPPRCRQIFILVKEEGLTYEEVAQLLDISKATVNVQMTLALKKIWAALTPALRVSHS